MKLKFLNSFISTCQNRFIFFNFLIGYFKKCCSRTADLLPTTTASANNSKRNKNSSWKYQIRLCYLAFFYNENHDSFHAVETMINPCIGCVGTLMRCLGIFLVLFIYTASSNMAYVFFTIIVPELLKTNYFNFLVHFIFGTWLVVNVFFHYTMGLITHPGVPPSTKVENVVSICKKCVSPKPARTHHCSVCNKCILKMDHHCPWFNNCIGFYNHRYFFLFVIYFTVALYYLSIYGFHYYQLYVYPEMNLNILTILIAESRMDNSKEIPGQHFYFRLTTIEFFVAFVASFALSLFGLFNGWIISKGITNIELKTVKIPCLKSTDSYVNPYDLGFLNNWKLFLGFTDLKTFFTKVILPSSHKPIGDGVNWYDYINYGPDKMKTNKPEIFEV